MDAHIEVIQLLKEHGAILVRNHRHEVWKLPNGKNFIRAKTPSDRNAALNDLSDLRRALDLKDNRGQAGERREKNYKSKATPQKQRFDKPIFNSGLADQLRVIGATEAILRETIQEMELEIDDLTEQITKLKNQPCECRLCRFNRRFLRLRLKGLTLR